MAEDLFRQYKKGKKMGDRRTIAKKILGLAKNGDEHLIEPVTQALKKEKEYFVRLTLRDILVKIGTDRAVQIIKGTTNDKSDYVVNSVVSTLDKVRTPAAFEAIKELFISDKNPKTRKAARDTINRYYRYSKIENRKEIFIDAFSKALDNEKDSVLGKEIINILSINWKSYLNTDFIEIIDFAARNQKNKTIRNYAKETIARHGYNKEDYEQGFTLTSDGKLALNKLKGSNLNNLNLNVDDLTITKLEIWHKKELTTLEGIEKFQNIEVISIINTSLKDMKNLSQLHNLKFLDLSRNQIENIEGLSTLSRLNTLNLSKNKISEIIGLNELIGLEKLDLSNNQITEVKGIEKLIYLKYLNLEKNPLSTPIGLLEGVNATKFIANLGGIETESIEKKSIVKPFHNAILRLNVKDRCLYCKKSVSADQNYQSICEEKLKEMIRAKNNKIPTEVTYKVEIKPSETRQVTGYKNTPNAYSSFTTRTIRTPAVYEKRKKKIYKSISGSFHSLAGTVCKSCSDKFLSEAKNKMSVIKTKGKAEDIIKSVDEAIRNLNGLIKPWIARVQQQNK